MKNKKYQKGFSALIFVIIMSAVLAFLATDSFEESALAAQLSAVERHYENFYKSESEKVLLELELIHGGF